MYFQVVHSSRESASGREAEGRPLKFAHPDTGPVFYPRIANAERLQICSLIPAQRPPHNSSRQPSSCGGTDHISTRSHWIKRPSTTDVESDWIFAARLVIPII